MHFFAAKLLSIAVLNELHLRRSPLKHTSHDQANLLRTHATAAHAHDARPYCGLMSSF